MAVIGHNLCAANVYMGRLSTSVLLVMHTQIIQCNIYGSVSTRSDLTTATAIGFIISLHGKGQILTHAPRKSFMRRMLCTYR